MNERHSKYLQREILLSFWKLHILHHAAEKPLLGQWMLEELRHHGYSVSPGTLYPMLHRMEREGLLAGTSDAALGSRAPRWYTLTADGRSLLDAARVQLRELLREVDADWLSSVVKQGGVR